MSAPIHYAIPGAAPRPDTSHKCPLGDQRITLPRSRAVCTPCGKRQPKAVRDALKAAWDEGRGAGSQAFADALAEAAAVTR